MPRKPKYPQPTNGELEILNILWQRGPSTVREVHGDLASLREVGYTTVLKTMQIMAEKGLVQRDENAKAHVYRAAPNESSTRTRLMNDLMKRAFEGSAHKLVLHALGVMKASPEQLAEIRKLVEEMEEKQ